MADQRASSVQCSQAFPEDAKTLCELFYDRDDTVGSSIRPDLRLRFGRATLDQILEKSIIAVKCTAPCEREANPANDASGSSSVEVSGASLVHTAFASFSDRPNTDVATTEKQWRAWVESGHLVPTKCETQEPLSAQLNTTLWMTMYTASTFSAVDKEEIAPSANSAKLTPEEQRWLFLERILERTFTQCSDISQIILFLPLEDTDNLNEIIGTPLCHENVSQNPYRVYIPNDNLSVLSSEDEEAFASFASKQAIVFARSTFVENVTLRPARVEDFDDLELLLKADKDLESHFGPFDLVQTLENSSNQENAKDFSIVAETATGPVGFMAMSSEVDVPLLNQCFDLSMYRDQVGLFGPLPVDEDEATSTARMSRPTILNSRSSIETGTDNASEAIVVSNSLRGKMQLSEMRGKKPLRIIIAGAPASGKGTQCELLKEKYGVVHLSTGDMLRAAVEAKTDVGLQAKTAMESGKLVSDDLIIAIIAERLEEKDCKAKGWLLDGFPRTRAQAKALQDRGIIPDVVLLLDVPDEEIVKRVTGRRSDPVTGKIYHMVFNPPPADDEELLSRLTQREDDTEEKAKVRLDLYHQNLQAILDTFDGRVPPDAEFVPENAGSTAEGLLERVDGNRPKGEVFTELCQRIEKRVERRRAAKEHSVNDLSASSALNSPEGVNPPQNRKQRTTLARGRDREDNQEHRAFAITLYCTKPGFEYCASSLLKGGFQHFTDRNVCFVSLPSSSVIPALTERMSQPPARQKVPFSHSLYATHRILSLLDSDSKDLLGPGGRSNESFKEETAAVDISHSQVEPVLSCHPMGKDDKDMMASFLKEAERVELGMSDSENEKSIISSSFAQHRQNLLALLDKAIGVVEERKVLVLGIFLEGSLPGVLSTSALSRTYHNSGKVLIAFCVLSGLDPESEPSDLPTYQSNMSYSTSRVSKAASMNFFLRKQYKKTDVAELESFCLHPLFSTIAKKVFRIVVRETPFEGFMVEAWKQVGLSARRVLRNLCQCTNSIENPGFESANSLSSKNGMAPLSLQALSSVSCFPPSNLYYLSKRMLFRPSTLISLRIVMVGHSAAAQSCLSILSSRGQWRFANITVVIPPEQNSGIFLDSFGADRLISANLSRIDRARRIVVLTDGSWVPYDYLILAQIPRDSSEESLLTLIESKKLPHNVFTGTPFSSLEQVTGKVDVVKQLLTSADLDNQGHEESQQASGHNFISGHRSKHVVVYGGTLFSICLVQELCKKGIKPDQIILVLPHGMKNLFLATENEHLRRKSLANIQRDENYDNHSSVLSDLENNAAVSAVGEAACLQDIQDAVLQAVIAAGVQVIDGFEIAGLRSLKIDPDTVRTDAAQQVDRDACRVLSAVVLTPTGGPPSHSDASSKRVLDCSALFCSTACKLDIKMLQTLLDIGLVYDGGLVVHNAFTTKDARILAGGSWSRFSRRFSGFSPHDVCSQVEVGVRMAKTVADSVYKAASCVVDTTGPFHIAEPAPSKVDKPVEFNLGRCIVGHLPGELSIVHASTMAYGDSGTLRELITRAKKNGESQMRISRLALDSENRICALTCLGPSGSFCPQSFTNLIGLPLTLLGVSDACIKEGIVKDWISFLSSPTVRVVLEPSFKGFMQSAKEAVMQSNAGKALERIINGPEKADEEPTVERTIQRLQQQEYMHIKSQVDHAFELRLQDYVRSKR